MYLFTSPLHRPDDVQWRDAHGYSGEVAQMLTTAYALIRYAGGQVIGYAKAAEHAMPWVNKRMSRRQRLHLYFVLATACAALGEFDAALYWADRALSSALHLKDIDAQLELLALRASVNRALLRFYDAIEDRLISVELLDLQRDMLGLDDPAARLHTLSQLATYAFFAAQPDLAQDAIQSARALAPLVPDGTFDAASAEWVQAHLYRTNGQPERALHHALGFYTDYTREASAISTDRLEFFIAEVALEWADRLQAGTDRGAFLTLARPHIVRAEEQATGAHDLPGHALAQLAHAHLARLSGEDFDRVDAIETTIYLGTELKDVGLLAQGYTTLGNEFAAREEAAEMDSALQCYRHALYHLEGSQVAVLAVPAKRALLRAQEMDPGGE
jgi:hypothetical protein